MNFHINKSILFVVNKFLKIDCYFVLTKEHIVNYKNVLQVPSR